MYKHFADRESCFRPIVAPTLRRRPYARRGCQTLANSPRNLGIQQALRRTNLAKITTRETARRPGRCRLASPLICSHLSALGTAVGGGAPRPRVPPRLPSVVSHCRTRPTLCPSKVEASRRSD